MLTIKNGIKCECGHVEWADERRLTKVFCKKVLGSTSTVVPRPETVE